MSARNRIQKSEAKKRMKSSAKKNKKLQNSPYFHLKNSLYLSLIILAVAGFSYGIKSLFFQSQIASDVQKAEIASDSAKLAAPIPTPSPTPKPLATIPTQAGNQVRVPILYYHYIGNNPNPEDKARDSLGVSPELFEAQMNYLATNGFNTITFDDLYAAIKSEGGLPSKPILLTFDDGYVDFYLNAFPVLKQRNLRATVFIITDFHTPNYYMSWEQIIDLSNSGLVSVQAHTLNHPNMTALSYEQMVYQASESKRVLAEKIGKPVDYFAYPYGYANEITWKAVKEAGYKGAVGTWFGTFESEGSIFDMPRIRIAGELPLEEFAKKVQ